MSSAVDLIYNEINRMPVPIIVYIYGAVGCGKTRMLEDVFATAHGIVYKGNLKISVWDDAGYQCFSNLPIMDDCDYFIIASNLQPDDLPIHMDHIFCVDSAEAMKECHDFLSSIYGQ